MAKLNVLIVDDSSVMQKIVNRSLKMLETTERPTQETIRDALGEICNMVAGSFKVQVSDLATQCWLSVPTVVSGSDHHLFPLADGMRMQVARTFEGSLLWITLDLHGN